MRFTFLILSFLIQFANAHEVDHSESEMKSVETPTGASIFQLDSKWKNQKGEIVKLPALMGKPRIVVMLYTRCETACPLIVEDLKKVNADLNSKEIAISIFSVDAARETPASLMAFAKKRKLPAEWELYTGGAKDVTELAGALGVRYKRLTSGEYIHSNVIFFLNKRGEITARKEGLNTSSKDFLVEIKRELLAKRPD